ncbi:MAG: YraN family protein, partial [Sphingomonadaceae bacterium]|nr:YraN family protein [Sphingomonadaceae bacterium]
DLIARRGRVVAFVEVKWRASAAALDTAIDAYRLQRVAAAAEAVAHRYAKDADEQRIDVLLLAPGRLPRHMANALML